MFPEYAMRKAKDRELYDIGVEAARYRLGKLCPSQTGARRRSAAVSWLLTIRRNLGVRDGSTPRPRMLGGSEGRP